MGNPKWGQVEQALVESSGGGIGGIGGTGGAIPIQPNAVYELRVKVRSGGAHAILLKDGSNNVLAGQQYDSGSREWAEYVLRWASGPTPPAAPLRIALVAGYAPTPTSGGGSGGIDSVGAGGDRRTETRTADDPEHAAGSSAATAGDGADEPLRLPPAEIFGTARFDDVRLTVTPAPSRFLFHGAHWLPEAGLYDHRARVRDPRTNVFLSEDPIGDASGQWNWNIFVNNNPTNDADHTGLAANNRGWTAGTLTLSGSYSVPAGMENAFSFATPPATPRIATTMPSVLDVLTREQLAARPAGVTLLGNGNQEGPASSGLGFSDVEPAMSLGNLWYIASGIPGDIYGAGRDYVSKAIGVPRAVKDSISDTLKFIAIDGGHRVGLVSDELWQRESDTLRYYTSIAQPGQSNFSLVTQPVQDVYNIVKSGDLDAIAELSRSISISAFTTAATMKLTGRPTGTAAGAPAGFTGAATMLRSVLPRIGSGLRALAAEAIDLVDTFAPRLNPGNWIKFETAAMSAGAPAFRIGYTAPIGGTYKLLDPATRQVVYVGRTGNLARRQKQWARVNSYRFEVDRKTNVWAEQRGREQIIYDRYNPPLNKIRPIRLNHPDINEYLEAGRRIE